MQKIIVVLLVTLLGVSVTTLYLFRRSQGQMVIVPSSIYLDEAPPDLDNIPASFFSAN